MLPDVTAATSLLPSAEQATALAPMTVPLVVQLVPTLLSRLPSRMVWFGFCAMITPKRWVLHWRSSAKCWRRPGKSCYELREV